MTGNGAGQEGCQKLSCSNVICPVGVECVEEGPAYRPTCGPCKPGYRRYHPDATECSPYDCANDPCYPGAVCYDSSMGPVCGPCPHGMTGHARREVDGCRYLTCAEGFCFPGAECYDGTQGPICGKCPGNMIGDAVGETGCRRKTCEDVHCFPGVGCHEFEEEPTCGPCPPGGVYLHSCC